jgi:nitronate monooxygenase
VVLVPAVIDAVKVPVLAAGGIADGRGVAAALALGADAAQIGTAFLACEESGAGDALRAVLRDRERARRTVLTRAFSGRLARSLANRMADEIPDGDVAPYPIQSALTSELRREAMKAGAIESMPLWAGQGAPLVKHRRAADLVRALASEAEAVVTRRQGE